MTSSLDEQARKIQEESFTHEHSSYRKSVPSHKRSFSAQAVSRIARLAFTTQEHPFILCSGEIIYSLDELAEQLVSMPDAVFSHHVSKQKNDFSTWVRQVLGAPELANRMLSAKSISDLIAVLSAK